MPQLSKPGQQAGFKAAEHIGSLVVFIGTSLEADVDTTYGKTQAARCAIIVPLDGANAGEVYYDSLVFGRAIVPSLTNADSDIVVGRVGTGKAKAGQSAPHVLDEPTDEEIEQVQSWLDENVGGDEGSYHLLADEKSFNED